MPQAFSQWLDAAKYRQQQAYLARNYTFDWATGTFQFVVLVLVVSMGWLGSLDVWVRNHSANTIVQALLFLGIIAFTWSILSLPFDWYHTFRIEGGFGFNTTTPRLFLLDVVKQWLLGAILGGALLAGVIAFYQVAGNYWWVYAWLLVSVVSILFALLYTRWLLPLFNKLTPLPAGDLREQVTLVAEKAGFDLRDIRVMDGSKRSTKGNAFFSGFGPRKDVVLYDTLIHDFNSQQVVAVLAHEIGHYKKKHVLYAMLASLIQSAMLLFVFHLFLANTQWQSSLGFRTNTFHGGLILFGALLSPVNLVIGAIFNYFSRRKEFEADRFAAALVPAFHLKEALIALTVKSLGNLTPHPWYVFVHYSHPTLVQRIHALGLEEQGKP